MRAPRLAVLGCLVALAACADEPTATSADESAPSSAESPESPASPSPSPTASASVPAPTSTPTSPRSSSPAGKPSAAPTPASGTRITAAPSPYGEVLFDADGQAVYIFDVETTSEPRCYGGCAEAWPPVLTDGVPQAGRGGVRDRLLGTTKRTDGGTQVTYDGRPLYYYAHEGKDEVRCHDVFLDGGNWYAVQPAGGRAP